MGRFWPELAAVTNSRLVLSILLFGDADCVSLVVNTAPLALVAPGVLYALFAARAKRRCARITLAWARDGVICLGSICCRSWLICLRVVAENLW